MKTNLNQDKGERPAPWGTDNIAANFWSILCVTYGAWGNGSTQTSNTDS